jgi:hypothetical protein
MGLAHPLFLKARHPSQIDSTPASGQDPISDMRDFG